MATQKTQVISDLDFAKLTKQANLVLSADAQVKIHAQLNDALEAVKILTGLDTTKIKNTTSSSGLTNVWREDQVTPGFSQNEALANAQLTHDGFFMVPAIFETEDN